MIQIVRKFPQRSVLGNEQHVSAISEPEDWSQAVEDPRAYIYSSTLTVTHPPPPFPPHLCIIFLLFSTSNRPNPAIPVPILIPLAPISKHPPHIHPTPFVPPSSCCTKDQSIELPDSVSTCIKHIISPFPSPPSPHPPDPPDPLQAPSPPHFRPKHR